MLESMIVLGQISLGIFAGIAIINILSFTKTILNDIIIPIISPFIPHLKKSIDILFNFLYSSIEMSKEIILNAINYLKNNVIKIVAKYTNLNNNNIEMTKEVYTLDENNNIKCTPIRTILEKNNLPIEIQNNLNTVHELDKELISKVMKKMVTSHV